MATRKYSCKDCGQQGFSNAWEVRNHKIEQHGAPARKRRAQRETAAPAKRRKRRASVRRTGGRRRNARHVVLTEQVPRSTPVVDAEGELLSTCLNAFANAGTDQAADARVLEYLGKRFGPEAYGEE